MSIKAPNPDALLLASKLQYPDPDPGHDRHDHVVHFYQEDGPLLDTLSRFIGTALVAGDAAIVVALKVHRDGLAERLKARGLDLAKVFEQGRYVPLDARETLSKILVDGLPDASRFGDLIGGAIVRAKAVAGGEQPSVAIFGEMVALLWAEGEVEAAIRLEQLWNNLAKTHSFSLHCAYPMSGFYREEHCEPLLRICAEHSAVIPTERNAALRSDEERLRSIAYLQQQEQMLEAEMAFHRTLRLLTARLQGQARLLELAHDAIIVRDPNNVIRFWNPGAERTYGWTKEEALGKVSHDFLQTEFPVSREDVDRALFQEGQWEGELVHRARDGARLVVLSRQTIRRDADGRPVEILEINTDITERKQAEQAVRASEARYRTVVDTAADAILAIDENSQIQLANPAATKIFGYGSSELVGQSLTMLMPEFLRELHKAGMQRYQQTGTRHLDWEGTELTGLRKNGEEFPLEVSFGEVLGGADRGFVGFIRDISERKRAEEVLRESEERFRLLVEGVQDYAVFMLDPKGHIKSWNKGAERIKGYKASDIIGKHFSVFYPEEDLRAGKPSWELEVAAKEGRFEDEGWRVRKDGSKFWANVIISALKDDADGLIGFGKVTRDITERMLAQKALQESQRKLQDSEGSLRQLSLDLLCMQDEERRRIGRDLHDSVGQYLSVLKMKLDSLKPGAGRDNTSNVHQELAQCADLAEESIKEVRTISYLLYPPMLEEMGLKSAISWYLEGFTKRSGINTTFDSPPDLGRLPRAVEMAMFRVLQESLTNVHRHSGSATAKVRVLTKDGAVVLEVSDQGKGIPEGNSNGFGQHRMGALGVGMRGMNERMRQLGGRLELSSTSQGTTVSALVPVEAFSRAAEASG